MAWLAAYLYSAWDLLRDLWLYMIAGFLLAAIVEEFVPERWLIRYFGANDFISLFRAAGVGFLVSACSCGAIPLVASLRDRGASTATLLTFLLASPWLGIPMLLVYVAFLGWVRTVFLVLMSVMVALSAGMVMARLERRGSIAAGMRYDPNAVSEISCCEPDEACVAATERESLLRRMTIRVPRRAWRLGKDIGLYLGIGIFLAAVPKAFVSPETIADYLGAAAGLKAIFVALPFSIAIEACSEGFAVVAGQLYEQGATLAVVFVMTMVGVATDLTELSVIWGKFGRRTMLTYVAIGTTITVFVGMILQMVPTVSGL